MSGLTRFSFRDAGLLLALAALPLSADTVRVYITNSAGDNNIHVIDPAMNKVDVYVTPANRLVVAHSINTKTPISI